MLSNSSTNLDAVVVGAGFSGLYMLYRLREAGFSTRVFEVGDNVGGTWYWNRYPGARCDIESIYYNYTFSDELLKEWTWSTKYAAQPEILSYINFVADKLDLCRDIQFKTRVISAQFDEKEYRWRIHLNNGQTVTAKYFITAVGCLASASNVPNFKGLENFEGEWYHTGRWPHKKVEFKGKRVGVIGTGSSGIQSIPVIAQEAEHLFVFQRTPHYSTPARNVPYDPSFIKEVKENYDEIRAKMRESHLGMPLTMPNRSVLEVTPQEREQKFNEAWEKGGFLAFNYAYNDVGKNPEANQTVGDFIRSKIREIVKNPEVAEKLLPTFYYGAKRQIIDTNYYDTYNRDNVTLVDVKKASIEEITPSGLRTADGKYELDIIVFATGFDAITGPLFNIDIRGKDGVSLKEKWGGGSQIKTYLGLGTAGFPNMFMLTGPQSPSVLTNMMFAIEQHVEWVSDCINYMRDQNIGVIEVTEEAENSWSEHCMEIAKPTLYTKTESWYTGANIEGKPRGFQIYVGGMITYRKICDEVADKDYEGFTLKITEDVISQSSQN